MSSMDVGAPSLPMFWTDILWLAHNLQLFHSSPPSSLRVCSIGLLQSPYLILRGKEKDYINSTGSTVVEL